MKHKLTVIHATDATHVTSRIKSKLNESITLQVFCVQELQFPLKPSQIHTFCKSNLYLIIISPKYLEFLETQTTDAVNLGSLIKHQILINAYYGAKKTDVSLFDKSTHLISDLYDEVILDLGDGYLCDENVLDRLMDKIYSFIPYETCSVSKTYLFENVIMVPKTASKAESSIYLIFTEVEDNIHVQLESEKEFIEDFTQQRINPYVYSFTVPDSWLDIEGILKVHVLQGNQEVAVKPLKTAIPDCNIFDHKSVSTDYIPDLTDEKIPTQCHTDNAEAQTDDVIKREISNHFATLLEVCKSYGLDELSDEFLLTSDASLLDSNDAHLELKRKLSSSSNIDLPINGSVNEPVKSTETTESEVTLTTDDVNSGKSTDNIKKRVDDESYYMTMISKKKNPITQDVKPHERILKEEKETKLKSASGDIYVPMKNGVDHKTNLESTMHLSKSQEELLELLHTYKKGLKTITELEQHFKEWQVKHQDSLLESQKFTSEKTKQKSQSKSFPAIKNLLPKYRRASSKAKDLNVNRQKNPSSQSPRTEERQVKGLSKGSDISTSSGCSESSDQLKISASPAKIDERKHADTSSTRWFFSIWSPPISGSCPNLSPTFDDDDPVGPELPLKPPPTKYQSRMNQKLSKSTEENLEKIYQTNSSRRSRDVSPDYIVPNKHVIRKKKTSAPETNLPRGTESIKYLSILPIESKLLPDEFSVQTLSQTVKQAPRKTSTSENIPQPNTSTYQRRFSSWPRHGDSIEDSIYMQMN